MEIDFTKDNYYKIKNDNIYQSNIDFDLIDGSYLVNIKIIDLKSRRSWVESIDIIKESSDLLSNLYFYYLDKQNKGIHINEFIKKDIDDFYCQFQYVNSNNIDDLNLTLSFLTVSTTVWTASNGISGVIPCPKLKI